MSERLPGAEKLLSFLKRCQNVDGTLTLTNVEIMSFLDLLENCRQEMKSKGHYIEAEYPPKRQKQV